MTTEQKIVLKLNFGGEFRRVVLQQHPATFVEIQKFVLKAFPNLGTDFTLSYLDEEGDKIHVETDMELLESTQPSTKENVLLIRLTVESRQKTSDPSIRSIPIHRNETEQNNTNKQFDEKSKEEEKSPPTPPTVPLASGLHKLGCHRTFGPHQHLKLHHHRLGRHYPNDEKRGNE
jgi:hypothetical protein